MYCKDHYFSAVKLIKSQNSNIQNVYKNSSNVQVFFVMASIAAQKLVYGANFLAL